MYGVKKREGWEVDLDNYLKEQEKADNIMEGLTNEFNSYDFSRYEKLCENIHKDLKDVFKEGIEKEFDEYYKEIDDDSCFDPQKILDNCFQSDYFLDNVEKLMGEDYFDTPEWDNFCETVNSYIYGNPVKNLDNIHYSEPEI